MNMSNLGDILDSAHDGQAVALLGREFGLTPEQTQAAVTALLPAISTGLKRSTATPEGLANLFRVMGQQQDLGSMYNDPATAFAQTGRTAGNEVLSAIFRSPDVSRAVADQAQQFSGVGSGILKKLLPVLAGMLISGIMKSGKTAPSPSGQPTSTGVGGGLGDILGQILGRGMPGASGPSINQPQQVPAPGGQTLPGSQMPLPIPGAQRPLPIPGDQPLPVPTNLGGEPVPGGGLLDQILRELQKGIQDGRIKPVIVPMPDDQTGTAPSQTSGSGPSPQTTGGDILGQILRNILAGAPGTVPRMPQALQSQSFMMQGSAEPSQALGLTGGVGAAVFGDQFEAGRDVDQSYIDNIQSDFDRYFDGRQP
jgi:hypothetical protein